MAHDTVSYGAKDPYGYRQTNNAADEKINKDLKKSQEDPNFITYRNYNNIILRLPKSKLNQAVLENLQNLAIKKIPTGLENKYVVENKETFIIVRPYSII